VKLNNNYLAFNKRESNPKWQSRMDNPEKLETLGTQETGRQQTKQKTENRNTMRKNIVRCINCS
jgi:hypothetical protein